ncbi:fungal specific transcription factor domain-containing protein [Aspergillus melleus]|uniref:fungal specific transcription factor domain-containing protein n=1 Tax=Aspergillus melleus TaxID=138277 RepID=UPI001E8DD825|nr:uncharacterized protein LDX57_005441 [Aspergillus melleus]KAH8427732.1 hypothetical protein LDX57_005441 [Aspergillus melleus]
MAERTHTFPQPPAKDLSRPGETCSRFSRSSASLKESELIRKGIIDTESIEPLLRYYANNYHCYLPIVPNHLLCGGNWEHYPIDETFLLTSVLTIATQDRHGLEHLHARVLSYMEKLLLRVVLGSKSLRHVSSVEGLLLLAEWVPHVNSGTSSRSDILVEHTEAREEDSLAWSLIGLAVRQAYLLHLEKHSFRDEVKAESDGAFDRKRLAWIFTYLADRQISIQMGQAFWCRGPGLSTHFTAHDYPSLHPHKAGQVDYASFIQAQVELTTIFGNVHDILYASKSRTVQLILMGDYIKYLDDSAKALDMWKRSWSDFDVPSHLKGLLMLQFEYLRLYMNAFAFQAVLYRSSREEGPAGHEKMVSYFPYSVMASPDGRHIYLTIDAAKGVLRELLNRLNPTMHLRFLPVRYYLYAIHASVFLFKAHTVGALSPGEYQTCFTLTRQFISMLNAAASTPKHIASKYAKLLASLWLQGQSAPEKANDTTFHGADSGQESAVPVLNQTTVVPGQPQDVPQCTHAESSGLQWPVTDMSSSAGGLAFMDSLDPFDCPDAFLCNLPFLRAGFPDLDDDVSQFLMADL